VILEYAESEHPRLTNREIISEDFQPMRSRYLNLGPTDGQQKPTDKNPFPFKN